MATRNSTSRIFGQGLTFDDVLLMPAYSEVLPSEVNIHAQLTKHIKLHVPVLSAAMDTVTEAQLAIALAREGGIGILHKNMSIERQAEQVRKVKRSESGMIVDPITLEVTATIGDALNLMRDNKIGGIPIVDKNHKLVGILTNRDLRFETDRKRKVSEVMTNENLIIAPEGTDLKKAEKILRQYKIEKLPVVNKQGKLIGLITYRDILQVTAFPNAAKDSIGRLLVGAALGITKDVLDRAAALQSVGVDIVSLDSAHGHSKGVIEALKLIKKNFKNLPVIAGNIATGQGALALAAAGADAAAADRTAAATAAAAPRHAAAASRAAYATTAAAAGPHAAAVRAAAGHFAPHPGRIGSARLSRGPARALPGPASAAARSGRKVLAPGRRLPALPRAGGAPHGQAVRGPELALRCAARPSRRARRHTSCCCGARRCARHAQRGGLAHAAQGAAPLSQPPHHAGDRLTRAGAAHAAVQPAAAAAAAAARETHARCRSARHVRLAPCPQRRLALPRRAAHVPRFAQLPRAGTEAGRHARGP